MPTRRTTSRRTTGRTARKASGRTGRVARGRTTTRATTRRKTTARARGGGTTTRRAAPRRSAGRSGGTTATRRRVASRATLAQRMVGEVMSSDPLTMISTETVTAGARMMRDNDIGDVIVLGDTDGRVCGIVTDRDLVIRVLAEGRDPEQTTLGAICSARLVTVTPDDSVDNAISMMREHAVRRLPVCENGKAVGIVSIGDLAERFDERSALADISAAPPNK